MGDTVLAGAVTLVNFILIYSVLALLTMALIAYIPVTLAGILFIVAMLFSGFVGGYIFAAHIREKSRILAAGKISVLVAAVILVVVATAFSGNTYYADRSRDDIQGRFSTDSWTTIDWFVYEQMMIFVNVGFHVAVTLASSFIGVYTGSLIRKPKTFH
jgi:hypothetical protein